MECINVHDLQAMLDNYHKNVDKVGEINEMIVTLYDYKDTEDTGEAIHELCELEEVYVKRTKEFEDWLAHIPKL